MIIYLIRHTKVDNPHKLCYGQSDIKLSDTYQNELEVIRQKLPEKVDRVFSSPLKRCTRLAEDLFGKVYTETPELMELNFGAWELRAWTDIARNELDQWGSDFVKQACPGGESYAELSRRAVKFWATTVASPQKGIVALVTHGGVIRALHAYITETPLKGSFDFSLDYGSVFKVDTQKKQIELI